jgi:hypothetical protein
VLRRVARNDDTGFEQHDGVHVIVCCTAEDIEGTVHLVVVSHLYSCVVLVANSLPAVNTVCMCIV